MLFNSIKVLEGKSILLVPMEDNHVAELIHVLKSPEIWQYTWRQITSAEQLEQLVTSALIHRKEGSQLPFTIVEKTSGRIVGTTRITHPEPAHRSAEIGCTWISPEFWRTSVNTEAKSLLLTYCFEELELVRIQFAVVGNNVRSQKAVERIGAVKEGILRNHRIRADGSIMDNVVYSILDSEWPAVKENLHYLLEVKYSS